MTRKDFVGLEFDWFATDSSGFVAIFSSAGWGPVPDAVFETAEAQKEIAEKLSAFCGVTSISDLVFTAPDLLADRGIFAYDWHDTFGPYRRLTPPIHSISTDALRSLSESASLIQLPRIRFGSADTIRAADIPSFTDVDTRKNA